MFRLMARLYLLNFMFMFVNDLESRDVYCINNLLLAFIVASVLVSKCLLKGWRSVLL